MSKKMKQILGIYVVAALVTLSLLCAIGYAHLTQLRRMAAYAARSSFETTVRSVDAMGAALQKSLYATDGGLCGSLCGEISASASAAEASLSVLPFDTQELEQLSGFINRAGDYAYSLAPQAGEEGFTQEQQQQLAEFAAQAGDFAALLRDLQTEMNNGILTLDSREQRLQNVGQEEEKLLSAALLDYRLGYDGEELRYDGKYTAREEQTAGELSPEQAKAIAARAAGVEERELKEEYDYTGPAGRRCYSAGEVMLCVSSRGLESLAQTRLVSESSISLEQARQAAVAFLEQLALEELALVSYADSGTVASFDFAQTQDGALRLGSGVKVSVALDDGSIYAYNAVNYSSQPAQVSWNTDEDTARQQLPENVSCEGSRKVILRSAGEQDLPCYEFSCVDDQDRSLRIYVNADTGKQCRIDI